jgi:hypothetical protein
VVELIDSHCEVVEDEVEVVEEDRNDVQSLDA